MPSPAKTEEAGVRRSRRNTKPSKHVEEEPDHYNASEEILAADTQMDQMDIDSPFVLNVSPTKDKKEPLMKRPVPGSLSASGQELWEQISAKGAAHKLAVDEWLQLYATNESVAVLQLINSIFRAGTVRMDLELEKFMDEDEEPSEVLSTFQENIDPANLSPVILVGRKRVNQATLRSFIDFWTRWAQSVFANLPQAAEGLGKRFIPWLVLLSTSRFRPLRQAGAFASFAVLVGLAKASSDLSTQLERASRMVQKKTAGLVDTLTAQLAGVERTIQHLFSTCFIQRFRDVDRDIRKVSLEQLGSLVLAQTGLFLDNHYIRYIGWGLSDRAAEVRLAALEVLQPLYRDVSHYAPLAAFTERFKPRLVEMASKDIDSDVKKAAQSVLLKLFQADLLGLDELQWLDRLVVGRAALGREGAALVLARCLGRASGSDEASLIKALQDYTDEVTLGLSTQTALHVVEHLVSVLAPSVNWLKDPVQAMEKNLPLALIEASIRLAVYPNARSRISPSTSSGLDSSFKTTALVGAGLLKIFGQIEAEAVDELSLMALFEAIPLLDINSFERSAELLQSLVALLRTLQSTSSHVLTSAVQALKFLASHECLSLQAEQQMDLLASTSLLALDHPQDEEAPAALLKAAHIMAVRRLPAFSLDRALTLLPTIDAQSQEELYEALLQALYQELLWRLVDQKASETPRYEAVIPLRDELLSAARSQPTRNSTLIAMDLLFLFGPQQEWMSETWRFPADMELDGFDQVAVDDDKVVVGLARLATAGYEATHTIIATLLRASDNPLVEEAISFIRTSVPLSGLVKALPQLRSLSLAKSIAAFAKKSDELSSCIDEIITMHRAFISHLEGVTKDNLDEMSEVAAIAACFTALLPPSLQTPLPLDTLSQAVTKLRRPASEALPTYIKSLEKHQSKLTSTARKLQLTPQKRKGRATTGTSRLKQSVDAFTVEEEEDQEDDKEDSPEDESPPQSPPSKSDAETNPFLSSDADASNAFKQLAIENENSPIPLRKKTILRN